ncbi:phosphatidylserine decarboxylase [Sulfurimonas sp. SAG-AH-194-C20]|nr:phosphatidylserine decarboxylase [Sulfurimonas sp. SAG-AH-194-C20]MDF1878552.1 phosphatidylserine decarboxylase [Sulfurimonas sp. SAG-AH-194-C20]
MESNLLPLSKEGISYLLYSLVLFVLFIILDFAFLAFFAFVSTLFIAYSFRNPERELCVFETASFLSPVDGIVESIEELENHKFAYRIEIQSSYRDVSVLRIPANVTVDKVLKINGTRVTKNSKLFSNLNENAEISFITQEKNEFKLIHRLEKSFAPLFIDLYAKKTLIQTARYGLMLNGSTSIYLPQNFRVNTSIGSELKASESLMGYFS